MTLVNRDHALEVDTLERVARIAQEPHFPAIVRARLDQVEAAGGPDGDGVNSAREAFAEAADEYVDGPAWTTVGLTYLADELARGDQSPAAALEARAIAEQAMMHAAHAAHLMRGALELLNCS